MNGPNGERILSLDQEDDRLALLQRCEEIEADKAPEEDEDPWIDLLLLKGFHAKARDIDTDARVIRFVVSTDAVDRDLDVLNQKGWELGNYRKNPVVLWAHQYGMPPIANSKKVGVPRQGPEKGKLVSVDQFWNGSGEWGDFAQEIFDMYALGFMSAVSVGFRALKMSARRDEDGNYLGGFDFDRMDKLEHSAVPVPSNPEALVAGASKGVWAGAFPLTWAKYGDTMLDACSEGGCVAPSVPVYNGSANRPTSSATPGAPAASVRGLRAEVLRTVGQPDPEKGLKALAARMDQALEELKRWI